MKITTSFTPWGECRRYFDDRGEVLYSEYVGGRRPGAAACAADRAAAGLPAPRASVWERTAAGVCEVRVEPA